MSKGSILTRVLKILGEALRGKMCGVHKVRHCLDHAMLSHGGSFPDAEVEAVKSVGRMMPVFLSLILYWTISSQV